nr:hypothetical protein CFP56_24255 [Quercus suber]
MSFAKRVYDRKDGRFFTGQGCSGEECVSASCEAVLYLKPPVRPGPRSHPRCASGVPACNHSITKDNKLIELHGVPIFCGIRRRRPYNIISRRLIDFVLDAASLKAHSLSTCLLIHCYISATLPSRTQNGDAESRGMGEWSLQPRLRRRLRHMFGRVVVLAVSVRSDYSSYGHPLAYLTPRRHWSFAKWHIIDTYTATRLRSIPVARWRGDQLPQRRMWDLLPRVVLRIGVHPHAAEAL